MQGRSCAGEGLCRGGAGQRRYCRLGIAKELCNSTRTSGDIRHSSLRPYQSNHLLLKATETECIPPTTRYSMGGITYVCTTPGILVAVVAHVMWWLWQTSCCYLMTGPNSLHS